MVPTGTLSPAPGQNCNPPATPDVSRIRNQGALIDAFVWITRLSRNRRRHCWAYNKTLAELLKCSDDKVTRLIDRLAALGAVVVEQVVGIERRVRPIVTLDALKQILFRGHEKNRLCPRKADPKPAPKPRFQPSVAAPSAETLADPVAEGHKRESVGLLTDSSCGGRTTTDNAPEAPPAPAVPVAPSVVVPSPSASKPVDPQLLAQIEALGVSRSQAIRDMAGRSAEQIRRAIRAAGAYLSGKEGVPGAIFRAAIVGGWLPPTPPSEHASDHGDRPVNVIRAPKDYLERCAAADRQAPSSPKEASPGALEALRAKTRAYRSGRADG